MEDKLLQTIRYKLQKRVRRLNSAKHHQFVPLLRQFFVYFEGTAILRGVRDELLKKSDPDEVKTKVAARISGNKDVHGADEAEAAAMGHAMLKEMLTASDPFEIIVRCCRGEVGPGEFVARGDGRRFYGRDFHEKFEVFRADFLEPFYEYIDENLDDQHVILYLLTKYKHRCEWFRRKWMRDRITADTAKGERMAAADLYEYLHNAGVDLNVEPKSASGIPDFVTEQIGHGRIIADTKLYWPEHSKGKPYIISGYNQVYTYTCDFNEQFGYLVIYKLASEDIRFLLPASPSMFPFYTYNNKTVFFIVVDVFEYDASASRRGGREVVDIAEDDLLAVLPGSGEGCEGR